MQLLGTPDNAIAPTHDAGGAGQTPCLFRYADTIQPLSAHLASLALPTNQPAWAATIHHFLARQMPPFCLGELFVQEMLFVSMGQERCVYFQSVGQKNKPLRAALNRTYHDMHYHIDNRHFSNKSDFYS
jgi:hypothetical protein